MQAWNTQRCRPPWPAYRVEYKTRQGWEEVHGQEGLPSEIGNYPRLGKVRKSKVNFKALDKIAFQAKGDYQRLLEGMAGMDPLPPLETIIDQMYPGNPWIARAAGSQKWAYTDRRESIRGKEKEFEWIVPNPMISQTGYAKSTRNPNSYRCETNAATTRRYIVIEFDFTKDFKSNLEAWAKEGISGRDVQAALIHWLAKTGPNRQWPFMIVDSGGKSLHSWYAIHRGFSEQNALALLQRAIPLGADFHAGKTEWFFRFPGGTRKSEQSQTQTILFYDRKKL